MKTVHVIWAAALVLGIGTQAMADNCKSPKLIVKNDKSRTIKVKKIQYYDGCDKKWRTEDVPNTEIPSSAQRPFTENLEYVGNCVVSKFKLYRAVRNETGTAYSDYEWGGELTPDEGSNQKCNTGVTYTVHAYDGG